MSSRVLVVDPGLNHCVRMLRDYGGGRGGPAACVESAAEAIDMIDSWRPMLVLIDAGVAVADGGHLVRQLRPYLGRAMLVLAGETPPVLNATTFAPDAPINVAVA